MMTVPSSTKHTQDPVFEDPARRLKYLQAEIDNALPDLLRQESYLKFPSYELEARHRFESGAEWRHIRVTAQVGQVDEHLQVFVARTAIELRACMDIAFNKAVDHYGPSIKMGQFPIVHIGDPAKRLESSRRSREEMVKSLPDQFVQAIDAVQPRYEVSGYGSFDVPINRTTLLIRDLSNPAKHRATAPVQIAKSMYGFRSMPEFVETVRDPSHSAWFDSSAYSLELRYRPSDLTSPFEVHPIMTHHLVLDGVDHRYRRSHLVRPRVVDFLRDGPALVRLVIKTFGQARRNVEDPSSSFMQDFNIDL